MKYINDLSPYIHQEMDFLTIRMLLESFDYENNIEAIKKGKIRITNKPTCPTSDKKFSVDSDKFDNASPQNPPKPDHQKKNFHKDKRDRNNKKTLLGNGVIMTIHHGMRRQNANLKRHFWKNC